MVDLPTPPDDDAVLLLNDVARLIRREADRRARLHGMTRAQWIILARVERAPGLTQRQLAELVEVEPITVGRLVDRLEARGLVERRPDPADRRIWRLHLLDAAHPLLQALRVQKQEITAIATHGIAPDDLQALTRSLQAMKTNIGVCRHEPLLPAREAG
jgi:DNA-binding MarR family transcriptional regulator